MINDYLRPRANYPIYPPYHTGPYLEEYFYLNYDNSSPVEYIDVFWTNLYCNKDYLGYSNVNIQEELLAELYTFKKYFTVCQHDDGPKEQLPPDTIIFSAGGNRKHGNIVPIPLICAKIPEEIKPNNAEKSIFCSFVGSYTHRIRGIMYEQLIGKEGYSITMSNWSNSISHSKLTNFIDICSASKFSLCPRGYGPSSFRLYESFQLNSVPVYISDDHYLPWVDELNWKDFCVLIEEKDIPEIDNILRSISEEKYESMLELGKKVYEEYFTLDGLVNNIKKRI